MTYLTDSKPSSGGSDASSGGKGQTTGFAQNDAPQLSLPKGGGAIRRIDEKFSVNAARYYLPWLGRWLSADPIGISGGLNLYEYTSGNPVGLSDTGGTSPQIGTTTDDEQNYQVPSDSEIHHRAIGTVVNDLERQYPGARVTFGSGTHGSPSGASVVNDPKYADPVSVIEDKITAFDTKGVSIAVKNMASPLGARAFNAALEKAQNSPLGTIISIAAWCYSTLYKS